MQQIHTILSQILRALLIGFGIIVPIISLIRTSDLKNLEIKNLFILTAIKVVRIAGLFYFIIWLLNTYDLYEQSTAIKDGYNIFKIRLFGKSWMAYWLPPVFYFLLTQAFWLKKINTKKIARITFALLILLLPSYLFIMVVSKINGADVVPFKKEALREDVIYYALSVIVFFFTTVVILLSSGKLKKIK